MSQPQPPPSRRVEVQRHADRASYVAAEVYAVIDQALICDVGVVVDGEPAIIPTMHARIDDQLYLHGARSNRTFRALRGGAEACVAITLLDGLVLARSAFNHSMNYRSVVVHGRGREITDAEEKLAAMRALSDHVAPHRWRTIRRPSGEEFTKTLVVAVPLTEAALKIRSGPPGDDEDDLALDAWAGVVPVRRLLGEPEPDPGLRAGIAVPEHVSALTGKVR